MISNDSNSTASLSSWTGSRTARALQKASLAALMLLPAACANIASSDGEADEGTGGATAEAAEALAVAPAILPRKSLEVTDSEIMSKFTLKEVMQQLLTQAGSTQTPAQLFFQMFDTEQPVGSPGAGAGPHCADTFNGFSFECPRFEGMSGGNLDPFILDQTAPQTYKAVALANRFDLADSAGAHCGQYRVAFARRSGSPDSSNGGDSLKRNFIIFEAQVPNPNPGQGILGCAPIAQFWQNLSESGRTPAELGSALHSFYFNGLPASHVGPVVHMDNYGGGGHGGQIRTNQFIQNFPDISTFQPWLLREFALNHSCTTSHNCSVVITTATDKQNPSATLFSPDFPVNDEPLRARMVDFRTNVLLNTSVLRSLATPTDLNKLDYAAPDRFNTGESNSLDTGALSATPLLPFTAQKTDYLAAFGTGPSPLSTQMAAGLAAIGSTLTPVQIVNRMQSLSCAGCHNVNNEKPPAFPQGGDHTDLGLPQPFPDNQGFTFTHTSEKEEVIPTAEGGNGTRTRFMISPALTTVFLPFRKTTIESYVAGLPKRVTATLTFQSSWSTGYCAVVALQNSGATPTTSWHVDVDLNGTTLTSSFPGNISFAAGDLSASNLSWNGAIPAHGTQSSSFGFCATRAAATTVPRVLAASGQ